MKQKLLTRLLCALLTVLMLVCMIPAVTLSAAAELLETAYDYTTIQYANAEERVAAMTKMLDNGEYTIYCDTDTGIVAYRKNATGELMFTNPWDMTLSKNLTENDCAQIMSQIILSYTSTDGTKGTLNSFTDAALKGQIAVKSIKNGIRVEYSIGELSARILLPRQLTEKRYQEITKVLKEKMPTHYYNQFTAYYNDYTSENDLHVANFDYLKGKKDTVLYVVDGQASTIELRKLEGWIKEYLPDYTFEQMDNDHDEVGYIEEASSPALFKMALEYTLSGNGLVVTLPANGLRYDETVYRITSFQVLPFMGACLRTNEGYSFLPDGSGALYELSTPTVATTVVYGEDYALANNLQGGHGEVVRMPVFGQYETDATTGVKRGFLAIIEEGESLASITPRHESNVPYASIVPSFVTRQVDTSDSGWSSYAYRRYTDDYQIRYIILSDEVAAGNYSCNWMGMASAYRDYLDGLDNGFERLTADDVETSIPLYIETFGCVDTVKKVLSMPVTVSVSLTSFEDIQTMYNYLAGEDITNVNFKMTGYANGGLYSDVPYKLKWEKAVGGKSGFKDLAAYAAEKDFGLYPDFDFVYTTGADGGSAVNMKKNAARTIDNRYTTRRFYSATKQTLVTYYQMVLSPATYSKFYEKLAKKYEKYENATGISLSTMGDSLNSDFNEDNTVLREEAKRYVLETLSYFKNKNYDVMVDGGNAFVWSKVDHILGVPLDSSRYDAEYASIPFLGVVLHGYVQFTGSALNMEGDIQYALLKAIENGASAYFVLSYANTNLLKEDELLSQNYSVRYDIWQDRLVEIYNELNSLLADVQTKLIINHTFLDGSRVPDEDELLQDIADAAREEAEAIKELLAKQEEDRINALRAAEEAAVGAADAITTNKNNVATGITNDKRTGIKDLRFDTTMANDLWTKWAAAESALNDGDPTTIAKSFDFAAYVVMPYISILQQKEDAAETLKAARDSYIFLRDQNANPILLESAKEGVENAVDVYVALLQIFLGKSDLAFADADFKATFVEDATVSVEDLENALVSSIADPVFSTLTIDGLKAFLATDNLGLEGTYKAFVALLIEHNIYVEGDKDNSLIYVPDLEEAAGKQDTTPVPPVNPDGGEGEGGEGDGDGDSIEIVPDPPKSKYSIDNKIVCVTYGEKDSPYKTFFLNFNDYAVQTEYNGVTYTIEGYGYVMIKHIQ